MDDEGNIIYHPQQQLIYSGLKEEDTAALAGLSDGVYDDDTVITCVNSVGDSGWRVVGVSYVDELVDRNVTEMVRLSALLGRGGAGGGSADQLAAQPAAGPGRCAAWPTPWRALSRTPTALPTGRWRTAREVQELSASFGHMVVRIQQLMTTVRQEEINLRKTRAESPAGPDQPPLFVQHPDSIAWMCEQGKTADAVKMVHCAGKAVPHQHQQRARADPHPQGDSNTPKATCRSRSTATKISFTYHFDVDPGCLDYLCNKITLQPIIENAINHGLDLMVEETGTLRCRSAPTAGTSCSALPTTAWA